MEDGILATKGITDTISHKKHERGTTGDSQFKGTKGVQHSKAISV